MQVRYFLFFLLILLTKSPLSLHAMKVEIDALPNTGTHKIASTVAAKALAKEVLEKGYFVHLAPLNLPEENFILKSGMVIPITDTLSGEKKYLPVEKAFRPCIYFSLNCAIDEGGKDEDLAARKFAVLIPTSQLLDKVVNLYLADTAVWVKELDLKCIPECVVFAPPGNYEGSNCGTIDLQIFEGSIHKAINNFIGTKTDHLIQLKVVAEGKDPYYDQALCKGTDLNNPALFNDLFENKPYLSFGHEACPKKPGIGPWLKFYSDFVDDFLRMWKQGIYARGKVAEPEFMKQYRTAPYIALAEFGLSEMEKMLMGTGDIETDFTTIQKPKIQVALTNFKKYITLNNSKPAFTNRLIDIIRLVDVFAHSRYNCFESVIETPAFANEKEEIQVYYWFRRYICKFHGVLLLEEKDELTQLEVAGQALRRKVTEQGYTWTYMRLLNAVMGSLCTGSCTQEFNVYSCEALKKIAYLLPKSGSVNAKFLDRFLPSDFKALLKNKGFNIPQGIWNAGTNLPEFSSNRLYQDSY